MNQVDNILHLLACKSEIKKFKDPRRVAIYSKISLTEEQKKEIDDMYVQNYGSKVSHTWHRHFTAFTGSFDKNYFPELLYIPEFEHYMNLNKKYNYVFSDKNLLPFLAQAARIKTPKSFVNCVSGVYRDSDNNIIDYETMMTVVSNIGEAFIKPTVDSCSGQGCAVVDAENGIDKISGREIREIIKKTGKNFVIQERIACHVSISKIYPNSVNTFRVISYIWNDEIRMTPAIMRIGRGGNHLDNAHAGGMFIAIDNDGTLHKTAFTEFKDEFDFHPDTNVCYDGYKIELFPKVLDAAKKMHQLIPQIGVVNWDFTINEEGEPLLIEMNISGGSIWLMQIAHGKGAFGDDTPEILQWMNLMKNTKLTERSKYAFGRME